MTQSQIARVAAEIGSGLLPDNDAWVNRFTVPSTSKPLDVYTVAQRRSDGTWGCSCWAWRRNRRCKHLERVLARLAGYNALSMPEKCEPVVAQVLLSARAAFLELDAGDKIKKVRHKTRQLDI
jgi:hypothetical protein